MKREYNTPQIEIIGFDTNDIITTSGVLDGFDTAPANQDSGWTGLY